MFEAIFETETGGVKTRKSKIVEHQSMGVNFCRDMFEAEFGDKPVAAEVELLSTHNVFEGAWYDGADTTYGFRWSVLDQDAVQAIVPENKVFDDTPFPVIDKDKPVVITPDPNNPVFLYVLVRNDMASFTGTAEKPKTGLPCAQSGHAANQMVYQVRQKNVESLNTMLAEWEAETGMGFGTEIVIATHYADVKQTVEMAALLGHHAAMMLDPTFPLHDGKTTHYLPIESCGYIFGRRNDLSRIMRRFDLMP
jgi:hypothetical protein